jgi:hypothetical protein
MIIQRNALDSLLMSNVCDIRFKRKTKGTGKSPTRRMLCTKNYSLLNSTNGRISLNFKPPSGGKRYNESINNVIIVWDIIMQDYRTINAQECEILNKVPANEEFWEYFNSEIFPMTPEAKMNFMNL